MTQYYVYFTARSNILVEANSEDEAVDIAMDRRSELSADYASDWEIDDSYPIEIADDE